MSFNFPPEIEDNIFELVVTSIPYLPTDAQLAQVSKRVRCRIEPLLYRTLILSAKDDWLESKHRRARRFRRTLRSKPESFFRSAVKNLLVLPDVKEEFRRKIMTICSGVEHLAIHDYAPYESDTPGIWEAVKAMPLRSLECSCIFEGLIQSGHVFAHLTYLLLDFDLSEYEDILDTDIYKKVFKYLPSLTHLAIRVRDSYDDHLPVNLKTALENVPSLKSIIILLIFYSYWGSEDFDKEIQSWIARDKRVEVVDWTVTAGHFWHERILEGENSIAEHRFNGFHTKPDDEEDNAEDNEVYGYNSEEYDDKECDGSEGDSDSEEDDDDEYEGDHW